MVLDSGPEAHAPTHHLVMGPDLAHNRASQPQYCLFCEICDVTSPVMYLIDTDYVICMPSVITY